MKFKYAFIAVLPLIFGSIGSSFAEVPEWAFSEASIGSALSRLGFVRKSETVAVDELRSLHVYFDRPSNSAVLEPDEDIANEILAAISLLPREFQFFYPELRVGWINANSPLLPVARYEGYASGLAYHPTYRVISVSGRWSELSPLMRTGAFFHELCHLLAEQAGWVDLSDSWKNIDGGWMKNPLLEKVQFMISPVAPVSESKCVSKYARTNEGEDWAESLLSYFISPESLRGVSENKFTFLDKLFSSSRDFDPHKPRSIFTRQELKKAKASEAYKNCIDEFNLKNSTRNIRHRCSDQALADEEGSRAKIRAVFGEESYSVLLGLHLK